MTENKPANRTNSSNNNEGKRIPLLSFEILNVLTTNVRKEKKKLNKLKEASKAKLTKLVNREISLNPDYDEWRERASNLMFETSPNSIQKILNECHTDVRKFINIAIIKYYKAEAGKLTMKLNTGITIIIESFTRTSKHYTILNSRKEILLDIISPDIPHKKLTVEQSN